MLDVLAEAVGASTGGQAKPRPGQVALTRATEAAMEERLVHAAEAPTGTGKTFAYLAPALWRAAILGERSLVTTATLSLQAQVVDKDAPVVADAVFALTGRRPRVAVLKGWGNYGCLLAASAVAQEESSLFGGDPERAALANWVLEQGASGGTGDKASCSLPASTQWGAVSMSPAECLGERCPKRAACLPAIAREEAAEADVVIVSHAMLAVQAATSISLLLGDDARFGPFDHVIVDEAHALVPTVRSAAAGRVSGASVARVGRALGAVPLDGAGKALAERSEGIASAFASALSDLLGQEKSAEVAPTDIARAVEPVMSWAARATRALPKPWDLRKPSQQVAASRAAARLERLRDALSSAVAGTEGAARWVEPARSGPALCVSPVDVSGHLAMNLWGAGGTSVVLVSATVPASIGIEAGLGKIEVAKYPSPLEAAYKRCRLYVPTMSPVLAAGGHVDLKRHQEWATAQILELVAANHGSALVLAATTGAALHYGAALRAGSGGWPVHVVGDAPAQALVEAWRADTVSVLVGTRGFMEGVDAPGATCSLVIVDRVPRSAPNPVDDARVSAICSRLHCDQWVADGLVYVADAALLLEQAAGRLVRRESDSGLLAVLDPRLRRGPGGYRGKGAVAYASALKRFPPALSSLETAVGAIRAEKETDAIHPSPEATPVDLGARRAAPALPLAR